jgi:hypothetical protein
MMCYHQNERRNYNVLTAKKSFENTAKFKYLGMTVTNQNSVHKETEEHVTIKF